MEVRWHFETEWSRELFFYMLYMFYRLLKIKSETLLTVIVRFGPYSMYRLFLTQGPI